MQELQVQIHPLLCAHPILSLYYIVSTQCCKNALKKKWINSQAWICIWHTFCEHGPDKNGIQGNEQLAGCLKITLSMINVTFRFPVSVCVSGSQQWILVWHAVIHPHPRGTSGTGALLAKSVSFWILQWIKLLNHKRTINSLTTESKRSSLRGPLYTSSCCNAQYVCLLTANDCRPLSVYVHIKQQPWCTPGGWDTFWWQLQLCASRCV